MCEADPTVRGAKLAEEAGADIIVVTGCDEGGCMPSLSTGTTAATALLADAVSIPVLAAGGIVNERMAMAAKVVGAEGVFVRIKRDRRVLINIPGVVAVATTHVHLSMLEKITDPDPNQLDNAL